jgi:hypothetical protein
VERFKAMGLRTPFGLGGENLWVRTISINGHKTDVFVFTFTSIKDLFLSSSQFQSSTTSTIIHHQINIFPLPLHFSFLLFPREVSTPFTIHSLSSLQKLRHSEWRKIVYKTLFPLPRKETPHNHPPGTACEF